MRTIKTTTQFEKDIKRMQRRNKDIKKLEQVVSLLAVGTMLTQNYRDHKLSGDFKNTRECHIEPDWLLIYQITSTHLYLARTGTHSDLFR